MCCVSSEDDGFYPNTRGTSQKHRKAVVAVLERNKPVEENQGPQGVQIRPGHMTGISCGGSLVANLCPALAIPWTVGYQAPLSM